MLAAAPGLASQQSFDDSAEREPITYQRSARGSRASPAFTDVEASPPGGAGGGGVGSAKARSSSHRTPSSSSLATSADASSAASSLCADLYMRMVDELVARGGCCESGEGKGNDDDVYFFQHAPPEPSSSSSRATPRQYHPSGSPPDAPQQQRQLQRQPSGRKAALSGGAGEREGTRSGEEARDADMDRLDSALARHQTAEPQRRNGHRSSPPMDVPVQAASKGKAAAVADGSLYTASNLAPESPFGSASSDIVIGARPNLQHMDSAGEWSASRSRAGMLERSLSGEAGSSAEGSGASGSGGRWPLAGVLEHYPSPPSSSFSSRLGMGGGRVSQMQLQLDSLTLSDNVLTTVCQSVQSTMHTELVGVTLFRGAFLHSALLLTAGDPGCAYIPTTGAFGDWLFDAGLPEVFVVEDTLQDPRFEGHRAVAEPPYIRFYAAAPIVASSGQRLGALCIADRAPQELDEEHTLTLANFSKAIVKRLENMSLGTKRKIVQSTLLRMLSMRDEALALVDTTTSNWQILYAKDSWEQQVGKQGRVSSACHMQDSNGTGEETPVGLWDIFEDASDDGESARPTERYEEYVCTSRPFKALVRPRHASGPDTLVTVNFRPAPEATSAEPELPDFHGLGQHAGHSGPVRIMQPYYIAIVEDVHQESGFDDDDAGPPLPPLAQKTPSGARRRKAKGGGGSEHACMGCTCTIA